MAKADIAPEPDWFSGLSDGLVGNGFDTIQVAGQFAHPLARRVGVGALGRLLQGGADVSDGLESIAAPGALHAVPQTLDGLKVTPIQSNIMPPSMFVIAASAST
jgi:hypothetical protein